MITVIFDMDGVLYRGAESIPWAATCISSLRDKGIKIGFLTNNSNRNTAMYVDILSGHFIKARENEIMTSGEATAKYLIAEGLHGARTYVVGVEGLIETMKSYGFEVDALDQGDPCALVVVGWDKQFTFAKIARAQSEIIENNARFIAANSDAAYPAAGSRIMPGAGAMVAAIEVASGRKAKVIGKPHTIGLQYLLENLGVPDDTPKENIWMVGDRLDTDIACGNAYGATTVMVTTGISNRNQARNAKGELRPDYVIDSLSELPGLIELHT